MIASLYQKLPADTEKMLQRTLDRGLARGKGETEIFFRADDIGVPGKQISQLIQLFRTARLPLCLAVVPSWLTPVRYETLLALTSKQGDQWCWHQHGWRHRNHETKGKKQEFGSSRPAAAQLLDIKKGKERLTTIMGPAFSPFFTPPWNRCSPETMQGLQELDFLAVSRSSGATPLSPQGLPDFHINADLHTRKEGDPKQCLENLLTEIEQGIMTGRSGIMIHHQRMDQTAFDFLALLLNCIKTHPNIHPLRFQEMSAKQPEESP